MASPEYHCQLVLVTKQTAVFHAPSAGSAEEAEAERQVLLQPAEGVEEQHADQREAEHRHGVGAPVLVGVGVDAQHAVRRPLDGEVLRRGVDVGEVAAQERHGDGEQHHEDRDLAEGGSKAAHLDASDPGRPPARASNPKTARVRST